ncbi:thermonuclease family protein [Candidatus Poriferisodalis sp.]|uniref:thermonuclease family protein n=1 Tax=Candidatus Poriferisodalis sp. TaxID=3101277 RepID=UPI003B01863D
MENSAGSDASRAHETMPGEAMPGEPARPPPDERDAEATGAAAGAVTGSPVLEANAVVLSVVDGDTIDVDISGNRTPVRLIGIDTPEKTGGYLPAECGGDAATVRTRQLLPPGTEVLLQRDAELYDRYDRLLAYVYRASDGLFVNRYLVLDGYAGTMHFEPNTQHRAVLDAAQSDARAAGRGIWTDCGGPDRQIGGAG